VKLTNEEFNTLCESSASTGLRGSVEHLITEAEAEMVERCLQVLFLNRCAALHQDDRATCLCTKRAEKAIRALSSDPDFLARERLKARLEELRLWRDDKAKALRIAELERELAAMEMK